MLAGKRIILLFLPIRMDEASKKDETSKTDHTFIENISEMQDQIKSRKSTPTGSEQSNSEQKQEIIRRLNQQDKKIKSCNKWMERLIQKDKDYLKLIRQCREERKEYKRQRDEHHREIKLELESQKDALVKMQDQIYSLQKDIAFLDAGVLAEVSSLVFLIFC